MARQTNAQRSAGESELQSYAAEALGWDGSLAARLGARLNNQKLCCRSGAFSLLSNPFSSREPPTPIPQRPHSHEALAFGSQISCLIPFPGYLTRSACLCSVDLPASALFPPETRRPFSPSTPFESPAQDTPNTAAGLLNPSIRLPSRSSRARPRLSTSTRSTDARLPF